MAKTELDGFVLYGKLFSCYANLLSEERKQIMKAYFDYNMTLTEIANERQVSRQAILDCIDKTCKKLEEFEKSLGLLKLKEEISNSLTQILKLEDDAKIKEKVEKILRKL